MTAEEPGKADDFPPIADYDRIVSENQLMAGRRAPRADAQRNRDRILIAARDGFLERGPGVALEAIAQRAGVGIATLYRHFADRRALMHAVMLDALLTTAEAAERATDDVSDAFGSLASYMHSVLDLRIAAVIPLLLDQFDFQEPELALARDRGAQAAQTLIDAAHSEGSLRRDVAFGDIGMLLIRLSRPLPGQFAAALDTQLAHRHLDLVLHGLQSAGTTANPALRGPALTLEDLRGLETRAHQ